MFLGGVFTLWSLRLFIKAMRPRFVHILGLPGADHPVHVQLFLAAVRVVVLGDGHPYGPHAVADEVDDGVVRDFRDGHPVDGDEEVPGPEPCVVRGGVGHDAGQNAGLLARDGEAEPVGAAQHLDGTDAVVGALFAPPTGVHGCEHGANVPLHNTSRRLLISTVFK